MNVKFPNNTSKWQIEFNSAFKGLTRSATLDSYISSLFKTRTIVNDSKIIQFIPGLLKFTDPALVCLKKLQASLSSLLSLLKPSERLQI
jgi:hypothetical protein